MVWIIRWWQLGRVLRDTIVCVAQFLDRGHFNVGVCCGYRHELQVVACGVSMVTRKNIQFCE